jgi:hypothetical protein
MVSTLAWRERMEENDLVEIIGRLQTIGQEWNTVDAKQDLILQEVGDKAEFAKDIIAMANNGEPSYLIIGLEDETFTPTGVLSHRYKKNDLNQILSDKIDPPLVVDYQEFTIDGNECAVVEVFGHNPPYIVARDLVHNKKDRKRVRIHKGTIYVRHSDRTEGISRSELEKFFRSELRKAFENETERALHLVLNQPDFWEYLLTADLLQSKVAQVRRGFADLERGLIYKRAVKINGIEFPNWASARCDDLVSLIGLLKTAATEEIPASWGEPGEPGDPLEIKRAVDKVASACYELLEWETDFRTVIPPDPLLPLRQMMAGWTSQAFEQIESLPAKLLKPFELPDPKGRYVIEIVFEPPSNVDEFMAELERLKRHPEMWLDS